MNKPADRPKRLAVVLFLAAVLSGAAAAQSPRDEGRIRALAARWEAAWNVYDARALAALFAADADFVNVGARHWKGRAEIEREHAARREQFLESVWTNNSVAVQFLKKDVALAHVAWTLVGDKEPDGTARAPRGGVFTWILIKKNGEWLIRAAQNTNLGPRQLPTPPKTA